jgi:hypothetical protein
MKRFLSYQTLRFPVAILLIFAVLTKAYQIATEPSDGIPWLAMGHVLCESGLALLLLSGVWPRWSKWATIAAFSLFLSVAVRLALKSAASCGCFGNVHVDPRITACMDAIIVLLLLFSPVGNRQENLSRKQVTFIVSGILLTFLLFIPMSLHPPVQRVDHGTVGYETVQNDNSEPAHNAQPPWTGFMPSEFRIGYVEPKSIHRFTLEIVNPTDVPRSLDTVETECECLVVMEQPDQIAPGKSHLTLEFTTPDIAGHYSKTITAISRGQRWTTRFHARINTPLSVVPETLVFSPNEVEKTVTVHNDGKIPVRLLYATSPTNACVIKVGAKPIAPGDALTLTALWNGTSSAEEQMVTIHTNHPLQKTLQIPFRSK